MNKRKTISILAGILLVSGGTFLGTKAYLKDVKEVKNDLIITTGTLEVEVEDDLPWKIVDQENTEISNPSEHNDFKNIRPGDSFEKTIKIKNNGSLSQRIKVNKPFSIAYKDDIFSVNDKELEELDGKTMAPGQIEEFAIKVSTNPVAMTEKAHQNLTIDFNKIINPAEIEANQINLPQ